MKKATFLLTLLLFVLSACSGSSSGINKNGISVPQDVEMSAQQFESFFNGSAYSAYVVEDYTSQFAEELGYPIKSYIIADNEENQITFEFMIFETEDTAKECYGKYAVEMDGDITADTITTEETNEDHAKYVFSDQKYRSITRIGKTIVMVAAEEDQGESVQNILLDMGY